MGKKTKEELAEQRRKRKAAQEERERLEEIEYEKNLFSFSEKRRQYSNRRRKCDLMVSDLEGWYEELDKQTKKSPADQITDLQLETVNDIIDQVKQLLIDDEIIGKAKSFVAAGDNPQYRDVIVVLRRLKQGLDRFELVLDDEKKKIQEKAKELLGDRIRDTEKALDLDLKDIFDKKEFYDKSLYDGL
jgi:hypothetical protein